MVVCSYGSVPQLPDSCGCLGRDSGYHWHDISGGAKLRTVLKCCVSARLGACFCKGRRGSVSAQPWLCSRSRRPQCSVEDAPVSHGCLEKVWHVSRDAHHFG